MCVRNSHGMTQDVHTKKVSSTQLEGMATTWIIVGPRNIRMTCDKCLLSLGRFLICQRKETLYSQSHWQRNCCEKYEANFTSGETTINVKDMLCSLTILRANLAKQEKHGQEHKTKQNCPHAQSGQEWKHPRKEIKHASISSAVTRTNSSGSFFVKTIYCQLVFFCCNQRQWFLFVLQDNIFESVFLLSRDKLDSVTDHVAQQHSLVGFPSHKTQ